MAQPAPRLLPDLLASLTSESLVASARAFEAARTPESEAALGAFHRFRDPSLWTTPYQFQAGVAAREEGVFAFDRLERAHLEAPASWVHREISPAFYAVRLGAEAVLAPAVWPFSQDATVADYQTSIPPKWWSHSLVHALIGFGWWPGFTEWHLMACARLSEAVAAVHWYNLAELGRLDAKSLPIDLQELRGDHGMRYAQLEMSARRAEMRARRLGDPVAVQITQNALDTLGYEAYAFRRALFDGDLLEPEDVYLALGEAADYARVHIGRLNSASHARWRETCLVAGRDYATDALGFEARAARALEAIVTPRESGADLGAITAKRARRVLQDLGWRVCHAAALAGDPAGAFAGAVTVIADLVKRSETEGETTLAPACEAVLAALPADLATQVLTLGYAPALDPTLEPDALKAIRQNAVRARAWRLHAVVGAAIEGSPALVRRVIDQPRGTPFIEPLVQAADDAAKAGELPWENVGYIGWLMVAETAWLDRDRDARERRWHYRLATRTIPPDEATWGDYAVTWNPYAKRYPMSFDARWDEQMTRTKPGEVPRFKPRGATAPWFCLVGPGRDGPIYVPLATAMNALIYALKRPRRLSDLVVEFGLELVTDAIKREAVLLFNKPHIDRPERAIDILEVALAQAATIDQRREDFGPWDEADQAEAYLAYCRESTLYKDTSEALCEAVGVPPDAYVAELGFGTGETTKAILARLGPKGRLIAADPAPRMVGGIMRHVVDDRARFLPGAARALLYLVVGEGKGCDRVIANSSIGLAPDMFDELAHCARLLAQGGRIGFSLPAEYLGTTEHMVTPEAVQIASYIQEARAELAIEPARPERAMDPALGSLEAMRDTLVRAGFGAVHFELYRRPWTVREYIDWLDLPVVRKGMCGASDKHRSQELIAALRRHVAAAGFAEAPLESVWYLVTAERREADAP